MPFVMTGQENRRFSSFRFVPEGIAFSGEDDFVLPPAEITAIVPDHAIEPLAQSVTLWCGMTVARLLYLGHLVRKLGAGCNEVLLVGGVPMWLAHRLPFSDIDFIASQRLVRPLQQASLHSIQRPKLDLQAARPLEIIMADEDLEPIPLKLGNEIFYVLDPICAALGNLRVMDTQRFRTRDLPLIYRVLQLQGAPGFETFKKKLQRVSQKWHFFPKEKDLVMSNYKTLVQTLDSIKTPLPSFPAAPLKKAYELSDFFV
jgi:hypothetical protein